MSRRGWPRGANYLYLLFLPKNVGACTNVDTGSLETCGRVQYAFLGTCGWHDAMPYNAPASLTPYAIIPYGESNAQGIHPATGCARGGQSPNSNDADATINIVSHEESEAITDPDASGWLSRAGNEIGDLCAWQYGRPLGGSANHQYNQVIAGHHYWLARRVVERIQFVQLGCNCADAVPHRTAGDHSRAAERGSWARRHRNHLPYPRSDVHDPWIPDRNRRHVTRTCNSPSQTS